MNLTKAFKELATLDYFKAQIHLEQELLNEALKQMTRLDVADPAFNLKYCRLQGQVVSIQELSNKRKNFINSESSGSVTN